MDRTILTALIFMLGLSTQAFAVKLQVLHTNDLHSYLQNVGSDLKKGGYPAIKRLFDSYRERARKSNLNNLTLDAGDFLEGNVLYKAKDGRATFKAHQMLEFDVVTLGNHDYLMGTQELDAMIGELPPNFQFLCANLSVDAKYTQINQHIKPYASFEFEGIKVAILGVTTDSSLYTWRIKDGEVFDPIETAIDLSEELAEEYDFIFAVNHIGLGEDKKLAEKSKYIDLIISGHSHDLLEKPEMIKNKKGIEVPIFQVGAHGHKIGRMILDLQKNKSLKVAEYETIAVEQGRHGQDETVLSHVEAAQADIQDQYGSEWLNEVVGYSRIPLTHSTEGTTIWGNFIADAIKMAGDAEIGIHTSAFAGFDQPAGSITRRTIMDAYPRFFELDQKMGWKVYKARVMGGLLKSVLNVLVNTNLPLNILGVKFDVVQSLGYKKVKNLTINGKKVKFFRTYSIALPEGVARGGPYVTSMYDSLFDDTEETSLTVWDAIENRVAEVGTVTGDFKTTQDRVFVPGVRP